MHKVTDQLLKNLKILLTPFENFGHGYSHCINVTCHAINALKYEKLTQDQEMAIILACLLHDADDIKMFPMSKNYYNTRKLLEFTNESTENKNLIMELVNLVSCRHNHNSTVVENWKLIPRFCDRLEAIGYIGIKRCLQYSLSTNKILYLPTTSIAKNRSELYAIADPSRFLQYKGNSSSMIDHFYDKILHIGDMTLSNNPYIIDTAVHRREIIEKFLLTWGKLMQDGAEKNVIYNFIMSYNNANIN